MKLSELAELTSATLESGSPEAEISAAAGLDIAGGGDVTFLANPKYTPQIRDTKAFAIFLSEGVEIDRSDIAVLRTKDAYLAYTRALQAFHPFSTAVPGVHPSAVIDPTATVSPEAEIGANVVIGPGCSVSAGVKLHPNVTLYEGVWIGDGSILHSGVSVRENCQIGRNCIIHNNSTIGSDGFGYAKDEEKRWLKIPQVGRVVLEDDV
ncbi:MAG: LpxD N-terminal domain-containing protein, partial [bacterium]|nr:LpxD N-terminal domain-containing protein [bacterium]